MKYIYQQAITNNTTCLVKSMDADSAADKLLELGVISQKQWDSIYSEMNIDLKNQK